MPFKVKKVVLKENDNIAVNELCAINKRRVRVKQMHPELSHTTEFNALNASSNPAVVQALENNMFAGIELMQTSQSENQKSPVFSSQPNFNKYSREKTFSTQNRPRQLNFENGQNTEREQYPYQRGRGQGAFRGQNRGSFSRNRSFHNRNE